MNSVVYAASEIQRAFDELFSIYKSFDRSGRAVFYEDAAGKFRVCTKYQALFKMSSNDPLLRLVHRHIVDYLYRAELNGPGCFDVTLEAIAGTRMLYPMAEEKKITERPSRDTVRKLIERFAPPDIGDFISDIVIDALELSGFNGKIVIERSSAETHLERTEGYNFAMQPAVSLPLRLKLDDVRCICIEGHIASVADGHFLFQQVHESGEPCALFVRGLGEEVKQTLKVNWDRGTMRIVPFVAPYSFEGANTLVDVATVAGGDLVSFLRGDRITNIKLNQHPRLKMLDVSRGTVVISNPATKNRVHEHLKALKEKYDSSPVPVQELLKPRIQTLLSSVTYVRLSDDTDFVYRSQLIDFSLRAVRDAMDSGVCLVDGEVYSKNSLKSALEMSAVCLQSVKALAAAVIP